MIRRIRNGALAACAMIAGCAMNFSEDTQTVSAGAAAGRIETITMHLSVLESRDIGVTGIDSDTVSARALIRRLFLDGDRRGVENPELTIDDGEILFSLGGGDWFSASLETVSIEARRSLGCDISSTTGDIEIDSMYGWCEVENTTGDISVHTIRGGSIRNTTGDIAIRLLAPRDSLAFESLSVEVTTGDIVVTLPDSLAVRLALKTTTGDIKTPGSATDYLNGGTADSPLISCKATTGDITLR